MDESRSLSGSRPRRDLDGLEDRSRDIEPSAVPGFERNSDGLKDEWAGDALKGVADESGDPPAGSSRGSARGGSEPALPLNRPADRSEVSTKRNR